MADLPRVQGLTAGSGTMRVGVFTHYFQHPVAEVAARIRRLGLECVQLNIAFQDWALSPETPDHECRRIAGIFAAHRLGIAAIAGYRNLMAPDPVRRRDNIGHIRMLLDRANVLGSPNVVTEAGSRHPDDDWAPCAENATAESMHMLIDTLGELAMHAEKAGANLVIEPSVGTVLDTPARIAEVAQALSTARLGFVADWPNLIDGGNIDRSLEVLAAMTEPLAGRIVLAHFKDANCVDGVPREVHHHVGDPALYGNVEYPAPGLGSLDLGRYGTWLHRMGFNGDVILEHLEEGAVAAALAATRIALSRGVTGRE
jgi:sugar phosphate isomerase/epimerase